MRNDITRVVNCTRCNGTFHSNSGNARYCTPCKPKAVKEWNKARWEREKGGVRICFHCASTYNGGPQTKYCPRCRADITRVRIIEGRKRWQEEREAKFTPQMYCWAYLIRKMITKCPGGDCATCTVEIYCRRVD